MTGSTGSTGSTRHAAAVEDRRLRVLVIDRMPPTDLRQGNALIGHHVFGRLAARHDLVLVSPVLAERRDADEEALRTRFAEVHLVDVPRIPPAIGGWLEAARATRLPGGRGDLAEAIRRLARSAAFDVVHVRQLPMAPYGRLVPARGRLLELVDSETLATRRDRGRSFRARVRRVVAREVERRALRGYGIVTSVADADAAVLRGLAGSGPTVEVVPNGVDADEFAPLDLPESPGELVFLGAMSFPPNIAAVTWFADHVLPAIRASRPEATFTIVGRDPAPAVLALRARPGIRVTGSVDDVRPYLARAALVVVPMVSGSGIKNKVLEALAMGRPIVATPLAVEGIEAVHGEEVAVAETPDRMAREILELLGDRARRAALGTAGRNLVLRRYSWDACADTYDRLYGRLAALRPRHEEAGAPARLPAVRP